MYTEREPYLTIPGTDSCWQTWHNSTVHRLHHRQTQSHRVEGWKDASEDNKWMIVQCATFCKSLNPRNIDKSVSDIRILTRFPFEISFWLSVSGCKLTIQPDIQPANRIVIISVRDDRIVDFHYPILSCFWKMISVSDPNPVFVEIILSVSENYPKVYCDAQHTFLCCVYFASWGKITAGAILPLAKHNWLK